MPVNLLVSSLSTMSTGLRKIFDAYQSGTKGDRIRVGRQAPFLSPGELKELFEAFKQAGIELTGNNALLRAYQAAFSPLEEHEKGLVSPLIKGIKTKKVFWGEEDWDFLVSRVAKLSLREPTTGLSNLAERIMQQIPEHNRKSVHAGVVSELAKRLTVYNESFLELDAKVQSMQAELDRRKAAPSKEEFFATLSQEEIKERFTAVILENLTSEEVVSRIPHETLLDCIPLSTLIANSFAKVLGNFTQVIQHQEETLLVLARVLAEMPSEKMRKQTQLSQVQVKIPQVALVGFLPDQGAFVAEKMHGRARIAIVDKNRKTFESSADVICVWTRFISHAFQESVKKNMKLGAKLILHHGGLETIVREIERALI